MNVVRGLLFWKRPPRLQGGQHLLDPNNRFPYTGYEDLLPLIRDVPETEIQERDFQSYSEADFYQDMMDATLGRVDADLAELVANNAYAT